MRDSLCMRSRVNYGCHCIVRRNEIRLFPSCNRNSSDKTVRLPENIFASSGRDDSGPRWDVYVCFFSFILDVRLKNVTFSDLRRTKNQTNAWRSTYGTSKFVVFRRLATGREHACKTADRRWFVKRIGGPSVWPGRVAGIPKYSLYAYNVCRTVQRRVVFTNEALNKLKFKMFFRFLSAITAIDNVYEFFFL